MKAKLRLLAWVLACAAVIACLNPVFVPKWTQDLATSFTIDGFYAEEKNSLDVVFFGSSQVVCGISPMKIYEKNQIKSYVLGTGSQPLPCTYYWLLEMVKYQKPKAVVVDTWMAVDESVLDDETTRHAMDYMRFSANKIRAAFDVERVFRGRDGFESTAASYLIPLLRFHSRWKELSPYDISYLFADKHFVRKGYCPGGIVYEGDRKDYQGVKEDDSFPRREMSAYQREYLQKIIEYCKKEQITLLFVKTPLYYYDAGLHNTVADIAKENDVPFLDFNMRQTWSAANLDDTADFQSPAHLNISGADKISDYLADYLTELSPSLKEEKTPSENTALWDRQLAEYRAYEKPYRQALSKAISAKSRSASSP